MNIICDDSQDFYYTAAFFVGMQPCAIFGRNIFETHVENHTLKFPFYWLKEQP